MSLVSLMTLQTPIGTLYGLASAQGLSLLSTQTPNLSNDTLVSDYIPFLDQTKIWLDHYFSKRFSQLSSVPLCLQGSPFRQAIWNTIQNIPAGSLKTYGEIALQVGKPQGAQATGQALKANPILLLIPCHRVVGQNNQLTGFNAGLDRKAWLIKHEGSAIEHET